MRKGQITIYCALSFALILSLFLSVMESARATGLRLYMECAMESALNSAFAEYNRELLEKYDVFFLDLSYNGVHPSVSEVSGRLTDYLMWNVNPGDGEHLLFSEDWYDITGGNADIKGMRLATDENGDVFRNQAVHFMEQFIGLDELENVQSWLRLREEYEIDGDVFQEKSNQAKSEWNSYQADEIWEKEGLGIDIFQMEKSLDGSIALLALGKDYILLSNARINKMEAVSNRENVTGSEKLTDTDWNLMEELLFSEYIMSKFGNYDHPKEDTVLRYELEYILNGMEGDWDNIQLTLSTLYSFRCAADFCSLCLDQDNLDMVKEVAEIISSLSKIPEPIVSLLILCIWAEAEALMDVRKLVDGKRVPLIREASEFTVGLNGIKEIADSGNTGIEEGLSYEDHLRILLNLLPPKIKVFRVMDLIEANIRKWTENEYFRMDACLDGITVLFSLESGFGYRYTAERSYYYLN